MCGSSSAEIPWPVSRTKNLAWPLSSRPVRDQTLHSTARSHAPRKLVRQGLLVLRVARGRVCDAIEHGGDVVDEDRLLKRPRDRERPRVFLPYLKDVLAAADDELREWVRRLPF